MSEAGWKLTSVTVYGGVELMWTRWRWNPRIEGWDADQEPTDRVTYTDEALAMREAPRIAYHYPPPA